MARTVFIVINNIKDKKILISKSCALKIIPKEKYEDVELNVLKLNSEHLIAYEDSFETLLQDQRLVCIVLEFYEVNFLFNSKLI